MTIAVQNITYTTAIATWLAAGPCVENSHSVSYASNGYVHFASVSGKSVGHKIIVPRNISSLFLYHLFPSTNYNLCVTCKDVSSSSDPCTTFHTLGNNPIILPIPVSELVFTIMITLLNLALIFFWARCLYSYCVNHSAKFTNPDLQGSLDQQACSIGLLKENQNNIPMLTALAGSELASSDSDEYSSLY
ncbi:fibronectin type III domain-containing protein 9-like [Huso huso]|uniref:Fibronectin type III domain-containing protein 9-like n=1 Tax=Huso huso TaxID=61971 RepID=A0ABR0YTF0_HUSHU